MITSVSTNEREVLIKERYGLCVSADYYIIRAKYVVISGDKPSSTILSGFSILCCGECRVQTKDDQRLVTLCVNVCVGVSQLFTVTFMFVGWFWSIAWGINMVTLAVEMQRRKKQQREIELQKRAVNAFGENVQRSFFPGMN